MAIDIDLATDVLTCCMELIVTQHAREFCPQEGEYSGLDMPGVLARGKENTKVSTCPGFSPEQGERLNMLGVLVCSRENMKGSTCSGF